MVLLVLFFWLRSQFKAWSNDGKRNNNTTINKTVDPRMVKVAEINEALNPDSEG